MSYPSQTYHYHPLVLSVCRAVWLEMLLARVWVLESTRMHTPCRCWGNERGTCSYEGDECLFRDKGGNLGLNEGLCWLCLLVCVCVWERACIRVCVCMCIKSSRKKMTCIIENTHAATHTCTCTQTEMYTQ